jgi:hypothetical protein
MRIKVCVLFAFFALAAPARPQNAVIAGSPPPTAKGFTFQPLERTPELLVLLATDCMAPEDYDAAKKLLVAAQKPGGLPLRFARFERSAPVEIAGPFRNVAELQAALRKLKPVDEPNVCPPAADFFANLTTALAPEPLLF